MHTYKHIAPVNASDIARALGSKGGKALAKSLPPEERRRIAALGGRARAISIRAARRLEFPLCRSHERNAAATKGHPVARVAGPLPNIHASGASHRRNCCRVF
jgi:hypothetical protein